VCCFGCPSLGPRRSLPVIGAFWHCDHGHPAKNPHGPRSQGMWPDSPPAARVGGRAFDGGPRAWGRTQTRHCHLRAVGSCASAAWAASECIQNLRSPAGARWLPARTTGAAPAAPGGAGPSRVRWPRGLAALCGDPAWPTAFGVNGLRTVTPSALPGGLHWQPPLRPLAGRGPCLRCLLPAYLHWRMRAAGRGSQLAGA
jgi:hypothetical protein